MQRPALRLDHQAAVLVDPHLPGPAKSKPNRTAVGSRGQRELVRQFAIPVSPLHVDLGIDPGDADGLIVLRQTRRRPARGTVPVRGGHARGLPHHPFRVRAQQFHANHLRGKSLRRHQCVHRAAVAFYGKRVVPRTIEERNRRRGLPKIPFKVETMARRPGGGSGSRNQAEAQFRRRTPHHK